MPNGRGYKNRDESMYQPAKLSDRERDGQASDCQYHGDGHDFNIKGKVTSTSGSDYHDYGRPDSGLHGNFAEKDASMAYLKERGMKGQVVKNYNGTQEQVRMHTNNVGLTAYNSRPISEVYKPATSQDVPPVEAVVHNYIEKKEIIGGSKPRTADDI